jgi:hypothetical protein
MSEIGGSNSRLFCFRRYYSDIDRSNARLNLFTERLDVE